MGTIADANVAQPLGIGAGIQLGVSAAGILEYTGGTASTNKQIVIGAPINQNTNTSAGSILNNGSGALTFTNGTFNPTSASYIAPGGSTPTGTAVTASRTLTIGGSYTGANNEIQGVIQNNASAGLVALTKTGPSTWVLSGDNTYTGATIISVGTLQLGNGGTTGALIGTASITNDGNLRINRSNAFSQVTDLANRAITGNGSFTQAGGGNTTLSVGNTYTGGTTVSAGILTFSGGGALSNTGTVSVEAGAQVIASATTNNVLGFASGKTWNISGTFNSSGGGAQTLPSTVNLNNGTLTGVSNGTFGTFLGNSSYTATITANGASNTISSANFGLGTGHVLALNTPLSGDALSVTTPLGLVGQTGALTKSGQGTVTLSGANNYTGATNVNAGKLLINGSTSTSSAVSVNSGGTLGGNGTIGGSVTVQSGGTFSPGNSIDSIASGNLALLASSTFAQEINKAVALGSSGDLTAVTGSLSITSGAILTLTELGASGAWSANDKITLIGYSTGTWNNGLFTYLGNTLNDDSTITFSGIDWTFNYNDTSFGDNYQSDMSSPTFDSNSRYVTMTAIPEPSAALLGTLGLLALLRRRR